MYEITSLEGRGGNRSADLSNYGNEWSLEGSRQKGLHTGAVLEVGKLLFWALTTLEPLYVYARIE